MLLFTTNEEASKFQSKVKTRLLGIVRKSNYKPLEDFCLLLLSEANISSMYSNNGGGQAWMKIIGIGEQGGRRKREEKG